MSVCVCVRMCVCACVFVCEHVCVFLCLCASTVAVLRIPIVMHANDVKIHTLIYVC